MPSSGPRIKHGYILKDNITKDTYITDFYKSTTLMRLINDDLNIDPFNLNLLRFDIPEDKKIISKQDDTGNKYHSFTEAVFIRDLNPTIVYISDRGFREDKRLTRIFRDNTMESKSKELFHNKIKISGKGRTRS